MSANRSEIERQFLLVKELARQTGKANDGWVLTPGAERDGARTPWTVHEQSRVVFTLGYTKRQALECLSAMTTILAVILGD